MKKHLFIILSIIFTLITGCKKEDPEPDPIACFTLSSYDVDLNEKIYSTNCSSNAHSYLWEDGDGNKITSKEPIFYYDEPGNYVITLTAYSLSGNKQSVENQTVKVEHKSGKVSFWQSGTPSYGITEVTINNIIRYITSDHPNGINNCDQEGCANFTLLSGKHNFYATDGNYTWKDSVTIIADDCVKFQLN